MTRLLGGPLSVAIALASLVVGTAHAQDDALGGGWYVSVSGLLVFPDDGDLSDESGGSIDAAIAPLLTSDLSIDFSTGAGVRAAGGVTLLPPGVPGDLGLSIELEYAFRGFDMDTLETPIGNASLSGDVTSHSLMVNFIGEMQFGDSGFGLYSGVGLGVAIADFEISIPGLGSASDHDTVFAWQVLGGVKYHINSHWMVFTGARFWSLEDVELSGLGVDVSTVDWELGFRFYF